MNLVPKSSTAQRLNGSTAQRLNGSTAQRLNGSTAQRLNGSTDVSFRLAVADLPLVLPPPSLAALLGLARAAFVTPGFRAARRGHCRTAPRPFGALPASDAPQPAALAVEQTAGSRRVGGTALKTFGPVKVGKLSCHVPISRLRFGFTECDPSQSKRTNIEN